MGGPKIIKNVIIIKGLSLRRAYLPTRQTKTGTRATNNYTHLLTCTTVLPILLSCRPFSNREGRGREGGEGGEVALLEMYG